MSAHILVLDIAGNPFDWVAPQEAIHYYAIGKVAWELGEREFVFRGGYGKTGLQSRLIVKPIIAIAGSEIMARKLRAVLPLGDNNDLLFRRDRHVCAYCAGRFVSEELTREHIIPVSRRGLDTWMNCITACRSCNGRKGNRLPEEARMTLMYLPYVPSLHEDMILRGRRILADQMEFLLASVPRSSRLHG